MSVQNTMSSLLEKTYPVLLLLFGGMVLLASLLAANRTSTGDTTRLMARKIYFSKTILPDHVFYPIVMVSDRMKLETSTYEEQLVLRVEYAERRYQYAEKLLEKDQPELALTTISKAQKYLFAAGNGVLADPSRVSPTTLQLVRDGYATSQTRLANLRQNEFANNTKLIDELTQETEIIYEKLNTLSNQ